MYYQNRPIIGINDSDLLKTEFDFGFHPKMTGFRNLHDKGYLTIINSVGYPNPNRSHFRSMDIWHSGSNSDEILNSGWIGRYLDACCEKPHYAIEADDMLSLALKGSKFNGMAVKDTKKLTKALKDKQLRQEVRKGMESINSSNVNNRDFLYKTLADTYSSAAYLNEINKTPRTKKDYPRTGFGQQLKSISQLIAGEAETKVYYVSMGGFDTHFAQTSRQNKLFSQLSDGLEVFVNDIEASNELDNTMILCFSEFGRRVKENASGGTDHGAGNIAYLIGSRLNKPGLYNELPDLSKLERGDVAYNVDFRSIYATILDDWLGADSQQILYRDYEKLSLFG